MKSFFTLVVAVLALFDVTNARRVPFKALQVRGGAAIGPLDGDLAVKVAKAAATAYVAGSASKYVVSQTGGSNTQLADFVTTDFFQLNALITAVSAAMFHFGDSGFDTLKMMAVANVLALLLRFDSGGFSVDTLKDNKVQSVVTVLLLVLAFVK